MYYTTSRMLLITFQNKLNFLEFLYWFTAGTRLVPYSDQNVHVPFKRAWSARASEGMLTHAEGLLNQRLHLVVTFPVTLLSDPSICYISRPVAFHIKLCFFYLSDSVCLVFSVTYFFYDGRCSVAQIELLLLIHVFHQVSLVDIQWSRV